MKKLQGFIILGLLFMGWSPPSYPQAYDVWANSSCYFQNWQTPFTEQALGCSTSVYDSSRGTPPFASNVIYHDIDSIQKAATEFTGWKTYDPNPELYYKLMADLVAVPVDPIIGFATIEHIPCIPDAGGIRVTAEHWGQLAEPNGTKTDWGTAEGLVDRGTGFVSATVGTCPLLNLLEPEEEQPLQQQLRIPRHSGH